MDVSGNIVMVNRGMEDIRIFRDRSDFDIN